MMDAPLGYIYKQSIRRNTHSLNPYYDGCASRLCLATVYNSCYFSLNPYYDGCASRLMLDITYLDYKHHVLILIMMDAPLGSVQKIPFLANPSGLNPYYDGCASRLFC